MESLVAEFISIRDLLLIIINEAVKLFDELDVEVREFMTRFLASN